MTKITNFTRAMTASAALPATVIAALADFAEEHGVTISYAGGTFTDASFTMRLTLNVGDPAAMKAKAATEFGIYCKAFGLRPEHLGGIFVMRGTAYRLTGIKPGRGRFPLTGERVSDGKGFKFGTEVAPLVQPAA